MDSDWLLIGVIVAAFLYFTGYRAFSVLVGLLILFIFSVSVVFGKREARYESGSNVLEPIVIESTRGAPYRIPEELNIRYDRKMGEGKLWEKREKKWGQAIGRVVRTMRGDDD